MDLLESGFAVLWILSASGYTVCIYHGVDLLYFRYFCFWIQCADLPESGFTAFWDIVHIMEHTV